MYNSQAVEATQEPINRQMTIKKNEILQFVTIWMDLEDSISEINQTEKDKNHML